MVRDISPGEEQRGYAEALLGDTLTQMGRFAEAADAYQRADGVSSKFGSLGLELTASRAESALLQDHFAEAAGLARRALESEKSTGGIAGLKDTLALALFHLGKSAEAARLCDEALAEALKLQLPRSIFGARMALLRVRPSEALMRDLEPAFANHPESRWRALAIMGRATEARQALDQLGRQWRADLFGVYLTRPDIQSLIPKH